jgi:hypothetical protein
MLAFQPALSWAQSPEISARRAAERKSFSDAQIIDGFFKLAFGAELHFRGRVDRIRKYEAPVRVYVDSRAKPDRREETTQIIADIKQHLQHLDIALAADRDHSNMVITLVRNRDVARTIRTMFGGDRSRQIVGSLDPQCLSGFRKDDNFRIELSHVILPVDAGDFVFRDCAYEEILQALGPINDDSSIPWTMFNDKVHMGFFDIYDQHILNLLYAPQIRAGMTRGEVRKLLPQLLPAVRAWVAEINKVGR